GGPAGHDDGEPDQGQHHEPRERDMMRHAPVCEEPPEQRQTGGVEDRRLERLHGSSPQTPSAVRAPRSPTTTTAHGTTRSATTRPRGPTPPRARAPARVSATRTSRAPLTLTTRARRAPPDGLWPRDTPRRAATQWSPAKFSNMTAPPTRAPR